MNRVFFLAYAVVVSFLLFGGFLKFGKRPRLPGGWARHGDVRVGVFLQARIKVSSRLWLIYIPQQYLKAGPHLWKLRYGELQIRRIGSLCIRSKGDGIGTSYMAVAGARSFFFPFDPATRMTTKVVKY